MKQNREMSISEIVGELGLSRQTVWLYMRLKKFPGAHQIGGLWWVAPRSEVLEVKERMRRSTRKTSNA